MHFLENINFCSHFHQSLDCPNNSKNKLFCIKQIDKFLSGKDSRYIYFEKHQVKSLKLRPGVAKGERMRRKNGFERDPC